MVIAAAAALAPAAVGFSGGPAVADTASSADTPTSVATPTITTGTTTPTTPTTTTATPATTTPATTTTTPTTTKPTKKQKPKPKPKPIPKCPKPKPAAEPKPIPQAKPRPIVYPKDRILSNETTHTRFAEADATTAIRSSPSAKSKAIAKLAWATPDGEAAQTYLLLREHWDVSVSFTTSYRIIRRVSYVKTCRIVNRKRRTGVRRVVKTLRERFTTRTVTETPWVELRVPMRPDGHVGWVPRASLGSFQATDMEVVINRVTNYLTVYRKGAKVFTTRTGAGAPDSPTPTGHFWITESFASTDPFYGPWAFGTSDYAQLTDFPDGSIVGIHGTDQPWMVPGNPSHGCVRVLDSDDVELEHMLSIGVPVLIKN